MSEENSSVSQNEEVPEVFQDDGQEFDVREAFGLPAKVESDEDSDEGERSVNDKTPAKEDIKESKKTVVKFNKEDVEIDEDKIPELIQKGLALDKERDKAKQSQNDLDRAAKLLGYKDHADLSAGLDLLEKTTLKDQQDKHEQLKQKMIDDLVDNGISEESARDYIDNNPLIQEGRKAIEAQEQSKVQQETATKWNELYEAYETLEKPVQGQPTPWYTSEMDALVQKGYSPLHAYELTNKNNIQQSTKKQVEQKLIKQQQLSNRTKVETIEGEQESRASEELRGAFSMFGIDPKRAQKYAK